MLEMDVLQPDKDSVPIALRSHLAPSYAPMDTRATAVLRQDFDFFKANQAELVEKYRGKVVVIRDQKIIGVFDDELSAVVETSKTHELGTFLVQRVEQGADIYTQVFHSRVAFA